MDVSMKLLRVISSFAILVVGFQILRKVLPWLYYNIIGPRLLGPRVTFSLLGKWAVVTGATDGIGKSYAKALAKRGMSIVIVGRNAQKVQAVSTELQNSYHVEVKGIIVDFIGDNDITTIIREGLSGLDIGVLVNNVGMSYPHPEYFLNQVEKDPNFLDNIVKANINSLIHMTAIVLPGMIAKKKGVIINLSSTSAVIPNPLLCVYSATKAFVDKFSDDLQTEYRDEGVIVQCVQPGFVATNMTRIRKPSLFSPSPDVFVRSAIKTVGVARVTTGYFPHTLLQLVVSFASFVLGDKCARHMVFNSLLATRNRALRNSAKRD